MDEIGLTEEDRKKIKEYLEKPAYRRQTSDLQPDDEESKDNHQNSE